MVAIEIPTPGNEEPAQQDATASSRTRRASCWRTSRACHARGKFVSLQSMNLFGWLPNRSSGFDALCEKAKHDLATKTAGHEGLWGLGASERWDLNQEVGKLVFTFPEKIASCDAQIIGTWNSRARTWLWAWSNRSIAGPLTIVSLKMRKYGEDRGIERFTEAKWAATEDDAWMMTALACLLFEQQGAYRGPAGETYVFMTFGEVVLQKK